MRKFLWLLPVLLLCAACSRGNIEHVQIVPWETSEIYTDEDISSAIDTAIDYFQKEFGGCTLTEIRYAGDDSADAYVDWAQQFDADEAIVLYSSFDVDDSGGDGSLNPNTTYRNWNWVLVRDGLGSWKHATHGY